MNIKNIVLILLIAQASIFLSSNAMENNIAQQQETVIPVYKQQLFDAVKDNDIEKAKDALQHTDASDFQIVKVHGEIERNADIYKRAAPFTLHRISDEYAYNGKRIIYSYWATYEMIKLLSKNNCYYEKINNRRE